MFQDRLPGDGCDNVACVLHHEFVVIAAIGSPVVGQSYVKINLVVLHNCANFDAKIQKIGKNLPAFRVFPYICNIIIDNFVT